MSWNTALAELRTYLSDGPTDRIYYRKRCIGDVDGVNLRFKTFEFRRVTDFTSTQGVFIDGTLIASSAVASDDLLSGEFILDSGEIPAPTGGQVVEATYYTQWFLDAELDTFLIEASRWVNGADDFTATIPALIPAAINYACSQAYMKLAQRWRTYSSEVYKMEDAPRAEAEAKITSFVDMAKSFREEALKSRTEYYKTRQGRAMQPLFGNVKGNVRSFP